MRQTDDTGAGLPSPAAMQREVVLAAAIGLVATVGLDALGLVVPFVRANLVALFALVFLVVPQVLLPRDGPGPEAYGLTWHRAGRGVLVGLGVAALTLGGFLPGHHLWSTVVLDRDLHPDAGAYVRPDDRNHGAPAAFEPGAVHAFHLYDVQYVRWEPTAGPWTLRVETDGRLWYPEHRDAGEAIHLHGAEPRPVALAWRTTGGSAVEVRASVDGIPLERSAYRLGPGGSTPRDREWRGDRLRIPVSVAWLPLSILFQVLLIALPEEFFYRGYLQRRLDQAAGRRAWSLGSIELSRSNLVVSALFALGHFAVGFDPLRLAVFFPSLVFGWLRDRTDGLAAPVTFHAACNLMVQVVAVHYW